MPHVVALATAVPPHVVEQSKAKELAARVTRDDPELQKMLRIFDRTGVETRQWVRPPETYAEERTFDERNAEYVELAVELAGSAMRECLAKSAVHPPQVDHLFFVTSTGLATPTVDARSAHRMGFRSDVKRTPIFGLGCAGGAAALSRANEYCRAFPKHRAMVLSVELGSLVFSTQAVTPTDLVGAALFGDGAAAVLVAGDEVASQGPRILFTKSVLFPGSEDLLGWTFTGDGMRLVLSPEIPAFLREHVKPAVERFLLETAQPGGRVRHYLHHPGGPKILEAHREAFGVSEESLRWVREVMRRFGDLGSAALFFVLNEVISGAHPRSGEKGLIVALGPGFAAEMILLGW